MNLVYNRDVQLLGIDHVTAITGSRAECRDFYASGLGLGLAAGGGGGVGDLCFGDGREGPAVLRFVDLPGTAAGTPGPGMVHTVRWWVPGRRALEQWAVRLELAGVGVGMALDPAGDPLALRFSDPEGLTHELIPRPLSERLPRPPRRLRAGMPSALSLAGVRAFVAGSVQSSDLLAGRLGFTALGGNEWQVGAPPAHARYACDPPPPNRPLQGAGTVHHVAWRCAAGEERAWRQRVIGMGATVSHLSEDAGVRWFFFREPDGVLFSVAASGRSASPQERMPPPARPRQLPPRIARPIGLRAVA
jgi:glyoxalase family protein